MKEVKVGLLGMGTVGTGVARLIHSYVDDLKNKTGVTVKLAGILVKDLHKERAFAVPRELLTENPYDLLDNPEIDCIIEVIGGIEPARTYIKRALQNRKHVITANKDLMAEYGSELAAMAQEYHCDLYYEASVAGGIPIIKTITDGFSSDRIKKIMGIVNGTTNYILTKMTNEKMSYEQALKEAMELGYAESDPTNDVEGMDAARKMLILATLGFHQPVQLGDVYYKGITDITVEDLHYAQQFGYTIKLLGIAKEDDGALEVSVQPTMLKNTHPLAMVHGVNNAIYVYGNAVGGTMFAGPGAGELPTATAVLSDLVTVVKNMKLGTNGKGTVVPYRERRLKREDEIFTKFFLRLIVVDKRGVLARIAKTCADHDISLEQIIQVPYPHVEQSAEFIVITHATTVANLKTVLAELKHADYVLEIKSCYRVEDE